MKNDCDVVLWGASKYAASVFDDLYKKYRPKAFGDNDPTKQGSNFLGLPVLSMDEITSRYPGCEIYITANETIKFDVINSLLDKGVDADRILNYEQTKRYKSCRFLESNLFYRLKDLAFCCASFGRHSIPTVYTAGSHEETMKQFFLTRDLIIEGLNTSQKTSEAKMNPCIGCYEVKDGAWSADRRIRNLMFGYPSICNFKCFYCSAKFNRVDKDLITKTNEALGFWEFIKDSGYLAKDASINISSGEISVHPLRDKILSALQDYPCWFFSNASVYSEKMAEILAKKGSRLISSIDAGTRETFKKIKGVDIFDKVCNNLSRYAQAGLVELKYIFLPEINDNANEVERLLEFCEKANIKYLDISRNEKDMNPLSDHTITEIARMANGARKLGINVSLPSTFFTGSDDVKRIEKLLR